MSFRLAPGHIVRWENTALPGFSNFGFCEDYYKAHSVLRRILSLARKLKYRSIVVEEIRVADCAILQEENDALAKRKSDFQGSTVHRLTFLKCLSGSAPQPHEFLGYAIFKTDHFGGNVSRAHVYESVILAIRTAIITSFTRNVITILQHLRVQVLFARGFVRTTE